MSILEVFQGSATLYHCYPAQDALFEVITTIGHCEAGALKLCSVTWVLLPDCLCKGLLLATISLYIFGVFVFGN